VMEHCNKKGEPKILPRCTLPLTGLRCIDLVITDLGVLEMDRDRRRFVLKERAPGVSVDEIVAKTAAEIVVPSSVPELSGF
jgi:3-oxoacid CoA-transferase subunit B